MTQASKRKAITFNADERDQLRTEADITIGGRKFRPRRRTNAVIQEWVEAGPDPALITALSAVVAGREDGNSDAEMPTLTRDQITETYVNVYPQLAALLETEDAEPADQEFLEGNLDIDLANELLDMLRPTQAEVAEAEGK